MVHNTLELVHLRHPLVGGVVSLDQIAHRHDEIGIEQIRVLDGLLQNFQTFGDATRAITINDKVKDIISGGRGKKNDGTLPRRCHRAGVTMVVIGMLVIGMLVIGMVMPLVRRRNRGAERKEGGAEHDEHAGL